MATIFYANPELIIAHNRKVLFLNPDDLQIFKDIQLPADLTTCGLPISEPTLEESVSAPETAAEPKPTSSSATLEVAIQHAVYSKNRQYFVLTTSGQKAVLVYKCRPEHAQLLSVRALSRASSALTFASDSSSVLVTDKTGDCYQYDCVQYEAPPRLLLGHLSIVYDIVWTPNQQHIITSDRDDKIRVTNYPATFDIHSYCLGHKEFVSGLALLTTDCIASVSGDRTLRIWNYLQGIELLQHQLPAPAVRLKLRSLKPDKYQLAVLFYDYSEAIGLYELERKTVQDWQITSSQYVRADMGSWGVCNFALTENRIYVTGAKDERFELRVYNSSTGEPDTTVPAGWLRMVHEQFGNEVWVPEDYSVWFKKRYDNVSEYMERKKRRMEDQQQK